MHNKMIQFSYIGVYYVHGHHMHIDMFERKDDSGYSKQLQGVCNRMLFKAVIALRNFSTKDLNLKQYSLHCYVVLIKHILIISRLSSLTNQAPLRYVCV